MSEPKYCVGQHVCWRGPGTDQRGDGVIKESLDYGTHFVYQIADVWVMGPLIDAGMADQDRVLLGRPEADTPHLVTPAE